MVCVSAREGWTRACVHAHAHAHSKWLAYFAAAEHFDTDVAGRPAVCAAARACCSFHAGQLSGKERERGAPPAREGEGGSHQGGPCRGGGNS